jgi:hypothetical protein
VIKTKKKDIDASRKSLIYNSILLKLLIPFPYTTIFRRAVQVEAFRVLFRAKEQKLLKIVPMGFTVGRIHLLVYQWDA